MDDKSSEEEEEERLLERFLFCCFLIKDLIVEVRLAIDRPEEDIRIIMTAASTALQIFLVMRESNDEEIKNRSYMNNIFLISFSFFFRNE